MYVVKMSGEVLPQQVRKSIKLGMKQYTIAFDIQETTNDDNLVQYVWNEVTFPVGKPTYGDIVASIIHGRYSDNEIQAIINNYLLEDGDKEHEKEWNDMQAWRAKAKQLAKLILKDISSL